MDNTINKISNNSIRIQPLNSSDFDDWLTLWNAYLTFYKTALPLEVTTETWRKLLDEDTSVYGFSAYQAGRTHGDKLIGIVHTVIHPNTWNDTEVCYLEDLYVAQSVRGTGAERALIEHVYGFAERKNCNRVYWTTQESNTAARKLYDKLANLTNMVQYRHDL